MRYMVTYDLMETIRNTNQWMGASALAMASYPAFSHVSQSDDGHDRRMG